MQKLWFLLYNIFFVPLFYAGFKIGSLFNQKMKDGNRTRKGQMKRIKDAVSKFDKDKKRIVFHASSVGEWEQAVPIIEKIKTSNPDIYIIVTFFSPSGYNFVKKHWAIDLKVYMPLDTYFGALKFFKIVKPSLWTVSKFDVWANHVFAAKKLNIPIILTAATLSSNSRRDKGIARIFNKSVYKHFSHFFPISEEDKERFLKLCPSPEKITVTGDTRFDQVFNRGEKAREAGNIRIFEKEEGITFIGGSVWPPDEKHLFPALIEKMKKYPELRAIIVPHELHESHISDIEKVFNSENIETERYTNFKDKGFTTKRVAIANTIGMLARLYMQTDLAYVGGSFSTGVHNVMEPAVFGQTVIFGTVYQNSFEAGELIKIGSAFSVSNSEEIKELLEKFISDENYRKETGKKAQNLIYDNLGATDKIYNLLKQQYEFIS